jgi:hypothetical protein
MEPTPYIAEQPRSILCVNPDGDDSESYDTDSTEDSENASAAVVTRVIDVSHAITAAAVHESSLLEQSNFAARTVLERVCGAREFVESSRQVMLIIHSDFSPDVFPCISAATDMAAIQADGALLQTRKITSYQHTSTEPLSISVPVTEFEVTSRYVLEIVGDEERDYPGVMEMSVPLSLALRYPACAYAQCMGRFLGAVNFPLLMRDVIIDIWGVSENDREPVRTWATCTVDGVSHAVLERLCISKQQGGNGELGAVEEVQMYARHPESNALLMELYSDL